MKNPVLIAPRSACRELQPGPDLDRYLAGDYLIARPKARTRAAGVMRKTRRQRKAEGWVNLNLWFDAEQAAAIKAAILPGEDYASFVFRMAKLSSLL